MSDVPNVTRQEVAVRPRHRFFLEGPFHSQKAASKLLNNAFYAYLTLINQAVGWVRPQPHSRIGVVVGTVALWAKRCRSFTVVVAVECPVMVEVGEESFGDRVRAHPEEVYGAIGRWWRNARSD